MLAPRLRFPSISDFSTPSLFTTMSSDRPFLSRKTFRGLITAPQLKSSDLMAAVQAVAQASTAFSPLQSASGGLLKAIEMVEVWLVSA